MKRIRIDNLIISKSLIMANQMLNMGNKKNVLLGASGSVACIKLPNIISELKAKDPLLNVSFEITL